MPMLEQLPHSGPVHRPSDSQLRSTFPLPGNRRSHSVVFSVVHAQAGHQLSRDIKGKAIDRGSYPDWARLEVSESQLFGGGAQPSSSRLSPDQMDNLADDVSLANPLQRLKRFSTGWIGVIIDYEGVVAQDLTKFDKEAWQTLIQESSPRQVLQWQLDRCAYMKNEQVVSELLCLSRNPETIRQLSQRKEELVAKARGLAKPTTAFGLQRFMRTLKENEVPVAIVTSGPESRVKPELEQLGLLDAVDFVVYAEDVARSRPDSEPYWVASSQIKRPLERCVVIASSNLSIEGAMDAGCKSVAIANNGPTYEVASADLVVKSFDMLSFINLKQLFGQESGREPMFDLSDDEQLGDDQPRIATAFAEL